MSTFRSVSYATKHRRKSFWKKVKHNHGLNVDQRYFHFGDIVHPFIMFRVSDMMTRMENQLCKWKFKMHSQLLRRISDRDIVYMKELSNGRDETFASCLSGAGYRDITVINVFERIVAHEASQLITDTKRPILYDVLNTYQHSGWCKPGFQLPALEISGSGQGDAAEPREIPVGVAC